MSKDKKEFPLKIGVIGVGYVGGAIFSFFKKKGESVVGYDKKGDFYFSSIFEKYSGIDLNYEFKSSNFEDLKDCNYIFMCLPTPFIDGFGFDYSAINENLLKLNKLRYGGIVILKSTVEPGMTRTFYEKYKINIVHNPEFLTARTAYQDFTEQKHIIVGGFDFKTCQNVVSLYQQYFDAHYTICDAEQAELTKLFCNNFYAVKVQLFNEFALTCKRLNISYEDVKETMLRNGWINSMHTDVPGPDGKFSYGGACFPKDTQALLNFMKRIDVPNEVLSACVKERNKMRND